MVPLNVAIDIAKVGEGDLQKVLCEAYQDEELRGAKLLKVRRFIDRRRERLQRKSGKRKARDMSSQKILLAYRDESTRQQVVVKQATQPVQQPPQQSPVQAVASAIQQASRI